MKTLHDITLYDLMSEDLDVWITKDKKFGYRLEIDGEEGSMVNEEGIHAYAMDSLADFCRHYIAFYDKASKQEAA